MNKHEMINRAIKNGRRSNKIIGDCISVKNLVYLIADSIKGRHEAIQINGKQLLSMMAKQEWKITKGAHIGGIGQKPDMTMHITLRIGKERKQHHLRMDKKGFLFEILGSQMREIPAWIAPGSNPSKPKKEEKK